MPRNLLLKFWFEQVLPFCSLIFEFSSYLAVQRIVNVTFTPTTTGGAIDLTQKLEKHLEEGYIVENTSTALIRDQRSGIVTISVTAVLVKRV